MTSTSEAFGTPASADGEARDFELLVIGGGPAGVSAALRGRELGATVALVERRRLGGTCAIDGCVPTRVLAHAARLHRDAQQSAQYGVTGQAPAIDFPAVMRRTHEIVERIESKKHLERHLQHAGVRVFAGDAVFADPHTVRITSGRDGPASPEPAIVSAERIVICAGGHARRLLFPGSDLAMVSSEVWDMETLPRSLAIVGAAATGCQLASVFAAFGARVELLEMAPRILPGEDEQVSTAIAAALRRMGVVITTGLAGVTAIEGKPGDLRVRYGVGEDRRTADVEVAILAVGWPGNAQALDLDTAGVAHERGYVTVDDTLRTGAAHIYAAGDITGRMMLVQSATFEANIAAENAVGGGALRAVHGVVPHGGFTDPEYASVGMTEERARAEGDCVVAVVPYADLDRAVIDGRTQGFCKLIAARRSRRILGAHVVGEQATEVVQLIAASMNAGARVESLAQLELAYPTFTAIAGLAARQLVRELGVVSLAPAWRALLGPRGAEWERSDT